MTKNNIAVAFVGFGWFVVLAAYVGFVTGALSIDNAARVFVVGFLSGTIGRMFTRN